MTSLYEGQKVVCIKDNFPVKATTEQDKSIIGKQPSFHPQVGETLVIDEMMGDEWLRFAKYDTEASWNWWYYTHFRPLDEIKIEMNSEQEAEVSDTTAADSNSKAD